MMGAVLGQRFSVAILDDQNIRRQDCQYGRAVSPSQSLVKGI